MNPSDFFLYASRSVKKTTKKHVINIAVMIRLDPADRHPDKAETRNDQMKHNSRTNREQTKELTMIVVVVVVVVVERCGE